MIRRRPHHFVGQNTCHACGRPLFSSAPLMQKTKKSVAKRFKISGTGNLVRYAKEAVRHAWKYAYTDRKKKRANMRGLWIVRLNAACREAGMSYSRFIEGLKAANIQLDRRQLSEIAIADAVAFTGLVKRAQAALKAKAAKA